MSDDKKRIEELYKVSTAALAAGDLDSLSVFYTEDAVQFPPDAAPTVGWAEIRASLEKELEEITFDSVVDVLEVVVVGDLAYARGNFRATASPKADDNPMITSGSFLDIFRREPDGSWRFSRSTWSNHPPEK